MRLLMKVVPTIIFLITTNPTIGYAGTNAFVPLTSFDQKNPILEPKFIRADDTKIFPSSIHNYAAPITKSSSITLADFGCPTSKDGLTDGYQIFTYNLTNEVAASLSYWSKAELNANDKVLLYQFTWYKDILGTDGSVEGRCGAGVMLALKVSNVQGSFATTLPTLAASAQLGQSSIMYKIGTFGLSGNVVDASIPSASTIGKFDTESYAALMQSINQIQAGYKAGPLNFVVKPRPIAVSFTVPTPGTESVIATQAFALNQVALGKKCKDAKNSLPVQGSDNEKTVENVYSTVAGKGCGTFDGVPSVEIQKNAKDLLARYKLTFN